MTTKECPIKFSGIVKIDCGKDKCAWWDSFNGACAMKAIATYLRFGLKIRE